MFQLLVRSVLWMMVVMTWTFVWLKSQQLSKKVVIKTLHNWEYMTVIPQLRFMDGICYHLKNIVNNPVNCFLVLSEEQYIKKVALNYFSISRGHVTDFDSDEGEAVHRCMKLHNCVTAGKCGGAIVQNGKVVGINCGSLNSGSTYIRDNEFSNIGLFFDEDLVALIEDKIASL
eukprot:TRINITY_DN12099_c0_g1_i1.p1 TRINITY_DN12099_c0_g1~~TRINITY_DN12099_c0_g1_i1.p1  ORF type:complete len:173 (-),score=30.04 TRINITY_DN12099_c0_g1_i1:157-675(-)